MWAQTRKPARLCLLGQLQKRLCQRLPGTVTPPCWRVSVVVAVPARRGPLAPYRESADTCLLGREAVSWVALVPLPLLLHNRGVSWGGGQTRNRRSRVDPAAATGSHDLCPSTHRMSGTGLVLSCSLNYSPEGLESTASQPEAA